ncbi:MAG: hypothetical protein R3217_01720 [Gammaproteobacteria bacterium]|nr:hypothetical protein [Gammaproteobacteria bacterium]
MSKNWLILMLALPFTLAAGEPVTDDAAEQSASESQASDAEMVEETSGDVLVIEEVDANDDATTDSDAPARMMREADFPTPERGMTMEAVRDSFGSPASEHPAVGEPPITRWDYDGYSVFFEYDKVLHSVVTQ